MKRPYLSIIIPTLNEEKFLPRLLEDLKKQKKKSFEAIVVDGGSKDKTVKKAEEYKKDFPLKIFVHEKRNVSFQRNFGAGKAGGKYLIFLDADVRISPFFLSQVKKEIDKSGYLIYLPSTIPQSRAYEDKVIFNIINFLIEVSETTKKPFSNSGSMVFEKNFFHLIGGFDQSLFLSEDHEIIQRAKKHGVTAKFSKKIRLKFSLRRMEKEGRLDLFRKYLIAAAYTLRKGGVDKKLFEYEMGGGAYQPTKSNSHSVARMIKKYFKRIKNQLGELAAE